MIRIKPSIAATALAGGLLLGPNRAQAAAPLVRALQGVLPVTVPLFTTRSAPARPAWEAALASSRSRPTPRITAEQIFGLFDADSDGRLSRGEFIALRSHGLGRLTMTDWLSRVDPAAAFALVDRDYDGWVSWAEFAAWERVKR